MRRWLVILALSAAAVLLAGRIVADVAADWLWFDSLGALSVYRAQLAYEFAWRLIAGVSAFAFAFLNLYAVRRSIVSLVLPRRLGNLEIGEVVPARILLGGVLASSVILGAALSAPTVDWTVLAFARVAEPFRELDPFLDRDLVYAVANLPAESGLYAWAARTVLAVSSVIVVLYALTPSLRLRLGRVHVSVYCRRHFAVLAALGLLLLAWRWRLDNLALTVAGQGLGGTYGALAHRVGGPFLTWASVMTVVAAFIVYWAMWHGQSRVAVVAVAASCVGVPMGRLALPYATGRTVSAADRREAERPYANARVLFTRRAFGVDAIDTALGPGALPRGPADALPGIPAWDPAALLRSIPGSSLRSDSAWLAWRIVDGGLRAVVLTHLPGRHDGLRVTPFDPMGLAEHGRASLAVPERGAAPEPAEWDRLVAYPGASGPQIIWDTAGHVPAPAFAGWAHRLVLAWRVRAPGLLLRDTGGGTSPRLAYRRDVRERVRALVPFLTPGPTVTPILRGDSLYWAVDLFTTASTYPLSEPLFFAGENRTYVHYAGTGLVQAGTGRVLLVAPNSPDAILQAWMRRFPDLFTVPERLPPALAVSRSPSVDWAAVQATALARAGRGSSPVVVRATVATDNADAGAGDGPPSFFAMAGQRPSLAWSVPVLDAAGSVSGVVVAVGGDHARTAWVSAATEQPWTDVLDRLQRAADSAGVGRQRGDARRGRVLAIPTQTGIVYVQSHYEWTADSPPALAGVAGIVRGQARAGTTRQAALGLPVPPASDAGTWRAAVSELYQRMSDALRRADWAAFGAAFEALGRLLRSSGR